MNQQRESRDNGQERLHAHRVSRRERKRAHDARAKRRVGDRWLAECAQRDPKQQVAKSAGDGNRVGTELFALRSGVRSRKVTVPRDAKLSLELPMNENDVYLVTVGRRLRRAERRLRRHGRAVRTAQRS
jgi:hypothetical protein